VGTSTSLVTEPSLRDIANILDRQNETIQQLQTVVNELKVKSEPPSAAQLPLTVTGPSLSICNDIPQRAVAADTVKMRTEKEAVRKDDEGTTASQRATAKAKKAKKLVKQGMLLKMVTKMSRLVCDSSDDDESQGDAESLDESETDAHRRKLKRTARNKSHSSEASSNE
jgi:hypothetical protein